MKTNRVLLCLLLLLTCALLLVGCNEPATETPVTETPTPETNEQKITVELTSPELTVDDTFAAHAIQYGETNLLQLSYSYQNFDFASYTDLQAEFYYGDRLLATRPLDRFDSLLSQEVCYGRVTVRITAKNSENNKITIKEGVAPISASEYNFATLNGSMPVLYFSLDLFSRDGATKDAYLAASGIPDSFLMSDVPTFVALERSSSYDWNALPENLYWLPSLEAPNGDFHTNNAIMAKYIRELYEINPSSTFHFYCVDNYPELILKFFVAQKIENFDVTMLSDGTGSASLFQTLTTNQEFTATEMYQKMTDEWIRIKTAAANGATDYLDDVYLGNSVAQVLQCYAFVIASLEENVTWVCARESVFTDTIDDDNFKTKIWDVAKTNGSVCFISAGDLFKNLSTADSSALKQLYKFDSDIFRAAGEKPILMYLGTSTANEIGLEAYLTYLIAEYGDEYAIYYKGHPGWPTALDANKQAMLDRLGVIDVESSIAAEIILFYCPDIYLTGYNSSTFYSAKNDHVVAIFGMTEAAVNAGFTYTSDTYVNPTSAFAEYAAYPDCFVVEYRDSNKVDIYNPATGEYTTVVNE